ncbi:hypothetical protein EYC80_009518 [Monilinia laxa]|uniref:Uncharacterized protein n=1 Tax=Monilinia laxa TaxID=61186 RepID=A0A5N6JY31_MONLA|nr:hypothetical protein EYC80_009518 [Monilinia laxa]
MEYQHCIEKAISHQHSRTDLALSKLRDDTTGVQLSWGISLRTIIAHQCTSKHIFLGIRKGIHCSLFIISPQSWISILILISHIPNTTPNPNSIKQSRIPNWYFTNRPLHLPQSPTKTSFRY